MGRWTSEQRPSLGQPRPLSAGLALLLGWLVPALSPVAVLGAGGADVPPAESVDQYLPLLDSADWRTRAASARRISDLIGNDLSRCEALLRGSDLTPEQRQRLRDIAFAIFATTPRGAMGVSFDNNGQGSAEGVLITSTHAPFEASRVLRAGDVVHAIDDLRVGSFADLRPAIISRNPGERVALKVFRKGDPLLIRLTLGNFGDLNSQRGVPAGIVQARVPAMLSTSDLRAGWTIRQAREVDARSGAKAPIDASWVEGGAARPHVTLLPGGRRLVRDGVDVRVIEGALPDEAESRVDPGSTDRLESPPTGFLGRYKVSSRFAGQAIQLQTQIRNMENLLQQEDQMQQEQIRFLKEAGADPGALESAFRAQRAERLSQIQALREKMLELERESRRTPE